MDAGAGAHALLSRSEANDELATLRRRSTVGASEPSGVRPEIADSWRRCRDQFGVSPGLRAAPEADRATRYSLDDVAMLAEVAGRAAILEEDAAAADAAIVLADGRGRVLATWGDVAVLRLARRCNLAPRACWSERAMGTNALGVALQSTGIVTVCGAEHWCEGFAECDATALALRDRAIGRPLAVAMICSPVRLPSLATSWLEEILEGGLSTAPMRLVDRCPAPGTRGPAFRPSPDAVLSPPDDDPGEVSRPVSVARPAPPAPSERRLDDDGPGTSTASTCRPATTRGVVGTKDHRQILFAAEEIVLAEAAGRIVWLVTDLGRFRCATEGLEKLEQRLLGSGFMRVHRRYLVNLGRIREVERKDGGELGLVTDRGSGCVPVSRRRAAAVARALGL